MKKITYFYLESCPYCQNARKAMDELKEENPDYAKIEMDWIEEERQPDLAKVYNYYYVPTMFIGANKLYEAKPGQTYDEIMTEVRKVFDAALEG
ncbi:MAG: glutaredoxin [Lachnospiraceae bacterium]|nr:glutaredoxin [Lachnospiraceae bacterium]